MRKASFKVKWSGCQTGPTNGMRLTCHMANSGVSKASVCGLMICQNGNKETLGGYSKMVTFE